MSERKKLIQVHSEVDQLHHCSCCDGHPQDVKTFYKELEGEGINQHFGFQTYLECCHNKVGDIVDWYNLEDYEKVLKRINVHGTVINKIAGYKP